MRGAAVIGAFTSLLLALAGLRPIALADSPAAQRRAVVPGLAADSAAPALVRSGTWGGDHLRLEVTAAGARARFDCAHGSIDEPLKLDVDGSFDASGVFVQEHGGPTREGEVLPAFQARWKGTVMGDGMTLTITLEDSRVLGPYTLHFGSPGRVFLCL